MADSTSAKASAAASCVGSLAIDGCIAANGISLRSRAALVRSAVDPSSTASPGAPRQRVSRNLARPSCSQMGTVFRPLRVTR